MSFSVRKSVLCSVTVMVTGFALLLADVRGDHCPFCSAINQTFAEQMGSNDVVVIATMTEAPKYEKPNSDELPRASFEITGVVKGSAFVKTGMKFRAVLVGTYEVNQNFVVMGVDPPNVIWSTPLKASQRVIDYVKSLDSLPAGGGKRLEFFQDYFEDAESILAFDAYDEFARAPYIDLIEMKDQIRHDQLIKWIKNPEIAPNRRRLYFTLLGICGGPDDLPLLEELISSGDRQKQQGLDALVGCYLVLKGEAGLELIEQKLLANSEIDYVDTLSAVSAIRFMGTESESISRERLCKSLRTLLERPSLADMIVPDLARWQDWSALEKLVELFRDAKGDTIWLRVAIFQYLRECPLPEAKKQMDELAKLDPKAFERASFFNDFGFSDSSGEASEPEKKPGEGKGDAGDGPIKNESASNENATEDSGEGLDEFEDESALLPVSLLGPNVAAQFPVARTQAMPGVAEQSDELSQSDELADSSIVDDAGKEIDQPTGISDEKTLTSSSENGNPATSSSVPVTALKPVNVSIAPKSSGLSAPMSDTSVGSVSAETVYALPVATVSTNEPVSRFYSFMLPVGSGMVIFLLLWSVINGWFERLIF